MRPSLQGRLRLSLIASLIVLFILQWFVVSQTVKHLTNEYVASRLVHDAETILAGLNITETDIHLADDRIDIIYSQAFSGHYFLVSAEGKVLRSRSLWDRDFPKYDASLDMTYTRGPLQQLLLVKTTVYRKQDKEIVIAVAEDISATEQSLATFYWIYGTVSVLALGFLILLQSFLVKRSFSTLERVREDVVRLERGEIIQINEEVPKEVYPLVKEFNRLLTIVDQRLARSRNALGNLAHALKAPLTVLMRLSDQKEIKQLPQLQEQLTQHTATIRRLMDRQLKSARLAGSSTPGAQFDCQEELPKLVDTLKRIYQDKDICINCSLLKQDSYAGDREDMIELFGNLLDNACKWARREVSLVVYDRENEGLHFTVEDDGPGGPSDQLSRVVERGVRLDESVAGHGLGLSIVKEIVQSYQGKIHFDRSDNLGGFRVEVVLPVR